MKFGSPALKITSEWLSLNCMFVDFVVGNVETENIVLNKNSSEHKNKKFPLGAAAYQLGNTSSCTITEVKQCWTLLVLGWKTVQMLPECCCC